MSNNTQLREALAAGRKQYATLMAKQAATNDIEELLDLAWNKTELRNAIRLGEAELARREEQC